MGLFRPDVVGCRHSRESLSLTRRGLLQVGALGAGLSLSKLLRLEAQAMHKFSIIRSMHVRAEDGMTDHSSGDQTCFTGYPAAPDPSQNVFPSCGSIVKRQLQHQTPDLPAYVMVPRNVLF